MFFKHIFSEQKRTANEATPLRRFQNDNRSNLVSEKNRQILQEARDMLGKAGAKRVLLTILKPTLPPFVAMLITGLLTIVIENSRANRFDSLFTSYKDNQFWVMDDPPHKTTCELRYPLPKSFNSCATLPANQYFPVLASCYELYQKIVATCHEEKSVNLIFYLFCLFCVVTVAVEITQFLRNYPSTILISDIHSDPKIAQLIISLNEEFQLEISQDKSVTAVVDDLDLLLNQKQLSLGTQSDRENAFLEDGSFKFEL